MGADGPIIKDEGHICPGGEEASCKDTVDMLGNQPQGQSLGPNYPSVPADNQAIGLSSRTAIFPWHWELKPFLNTDGLT